MLKKLVTIFIILLMPSISVAKVNSDYQVKFDYHNYAKEREIAHKYFLEVFNSSKTFATIKPSDIGIDLYDIDNDNEKEVLAYVNFADRCPKNGCPFAILKMLTSDDYQAINWGGNLAIHNSPLILKDLTSGYHDVLFKAKDNSKHIWQWDGTSSYRLKKKLIS